MKYISTTECINGHRYFIVRIEHEDGTPYGGYTWSLEGSHSQVEFNKRKAITEYEHERMKNIGK
jgi:hypothetical protein